MLSISGLCSVISDGALSSRKEEVQRYSNLQVSGEVDGVFALGTGAEQRATVLAQAEADAKAQAVRAGADPDRCQVLLPFCLVFYCL